MSCFFSSFSLAGWLFLLGINPYTTFYPCRYCHRITIYNIRPQALSSQFKKPPIFTTVLRNPGRLRKFHQLEFPLKKANTSYAFNRAPSGTIPFSMYLHKPISSFLANATIPIRRIRFPPNANRSVNHLLNILCP